MGNQCVYVIYTDTTELIFLVLAKIGKETVLSLGMISKSR